MADWEGLGATPDAVGTLLVEAAARIRDKGWVQGRFVDEETGAVDAAQAVADVLGLSLVSCSRKEFRLPVGAAVLLGAALARACAHVGAAYLTHWNDDPARTADEVAAALEAAGRA